MDLAKLKAAQAEEAVRDDEDAEVAAAEVPVAEAAEAAKPAEISTVVDEHPAGDAEVATQDVPEAAVAEEEAADTDQAVNAGDSEPKPAEAQEDAPDATVAEPEVASEEAVVSGQVDAAAQVVRPGPRVDVFADLPHTPPQSQPSTSPAPAAGQQPEIHPEGGSLGARPADVVSTATPQAPQPAMPQPMGPGMRMPGGPMPMGGGMAPQIGQAGMQAGQALSALVAAPLTAVSGIAKGFSTGLQAWMERRGMQQRGEAQAAFGLAVEDAESAVVEAELASMKLARMADRFRSHPTFKSLADEMERAGQPDGKTIRDVIGEMKTGGKFEGLWTKFSQALGSDDRLQAEHDALHTQMDLHRRTWETAAQAVERVNGNSDALWSRLDKATAKVRTATQGIPAEEGQSFADKAREVMEHMRDFFCRLFRLSPQDGQKMAGAGRRP